MKSVLIRLIWNCSYDFELIYDPSNDAQQQLAALRQAEQVKSNITIFCKVTKSHLHTA